MDPFPMPKSATLTALDDLLIGDAASQAAFDKVIEAMHRYAHVAGVPAGTDVVAHFASVHRTHKDARWRLMMAQMNAPSSFTMQQVQSRHMDFRQLMWVGMGFDEIDKAPKLQATMNEQVDALIERTRQRMNKIKPGLLNNVFGGVWKDVF